ncbi:MAG: hypothetical protein HKM92_11305, partial [Arenibacter sp.]|nr:hypothetical protein [Arenibacter sp.]
LSKKGFESKYFHRKFNDFHYVYLGYYSTWDEALYAMENNYNGEYTEETWIFRMVDK